MECPQTDNKLVGVRFLVHGIENHVLLRQREPDLSKPKLILVIGAFYSHTLVWLPRVTKWTCLGMKFNLQMFWGCPQRGNVTWWESEPKRGVMWLRGLTQKHIRKLFKNPLASNRKSLGYKLYLSQELITFLKAWGKRVAKGVDLLWQGQHVICVYKNIDLPKVGVNHMPFHLKDVLSGYGLHIGTTLVRH